MSTRAERLAASKAMWANTSWDDVATFLGPNAERFQRVWEKTQAKAVEKGVGMALGWSWPAFVFGFAWFLYRKQWAVGVLLLVAPIALGYFVESSGSALAGVGIVMAMYAKSFLIQHAVIKIAKIKQAGGGSDKIAAAGGVSVPVGIVGGILWLLAVASVGALFYGYF